ncbi:Imm50 family immunity protein [Streptomyces sp. 7R007]
MSADGTLLLRSPDQLGEPFYVHIDERGNSVTLGFLTRGLPRDAPAEWREKGFNAVESTFVCEGLAELRVTGWGAAEAKSVDVVVRDAGVEVVLGSEESGISFRARTVRLARTRAYLASDSP